MTRSAGKGRGLKLAWFSALAVAGLAATRPAAAQDCSGIEPYVFILFDTSGSMNWAPPCSQAELSAGLCAARCDSYDCWVPLQGDDPSSKLYQTKQALYEVLSNTTGIQFGFATFNQDALYARAKHWLYQAGGPGINIPGWGPFPSTGAREVFGSLWNCDTGSGDNDIGCYSTTPADLVDAWELGRTQELPKLGKSFTEVVQFYVRQSGIVYRVRYTPVFGATPGGPVTVTEAVWRCLNSACSSTTSLGQINISFTPVAEMLTWDNGALNRTNPELGYFSQPVGTDTDATNTCAGWEPNTDSSADLYTTPTGSYNLHWPTTADSRGAEFSFGDVIPQDWLTPHTDDILRRLSPSYPAAPDFRVSPYFQNQPFGPETFLRLKDVGKRPLIAYGSTPQGNALVAFRTWWSGCSTNFCIGGGWNGIAQTQDPDWLCRRHYLVVLTDGEETCNGDPCAQTSALLSYGIKTYVVGFGVIAAPGSKLLCMAGNGGTDSPILPHTRQELIDSLTVIFDAVKAGS
jgi:hypothetical protein